MAEIHVLDKHTAELIAAGEVVERPASAVKELIENAIDAGATQVTVTIENGGVRFIEISDNGCGIETEQIDKAFIRHATSKIASADDLDHIHTLGFRGEALASIASVARVEVLTKTADEEFACDYRIEGGETLGMETGARGTGTTIRVRDLFYNTPARMKFLKKDSSEGTFVADVVNHAALSHPEVGVKFVREGKAQYVAPGDGKLMSAAYAVLGREFSRDLLTVEDTTGNYHVSGLVTPPKGCRASRGMQLFYINGRYVKNRTLMAAMETAFKGTAMQGKFPGGILCIEMPAELVDVNVHPAKTEVRFARENDVFEAVYRAVKSALAQPGSGERLFVFDHNAPEAAGDAAASSRSAGLAAAVSGQAEPGVPKRGLCEADILEIPKQTTGAASAPISEENNAFMRKESGISAMHGESAAPAAYGAGADETNRDAAKADSDVENFSALPPDGHFSLHSPACTSFRTVAADERGLDILPQDAPESATGISCAETMRPDEREPEFSNELGMQQTTFLEESQGETLQYVGELFRTYILAQRGENEVCLIDKHAAHERLLYEQLANHYGEVAGQMLLAPVAVELTAAEKQAVLEQKSLLEAAGFDVDDFGGNTVAVRQVPCDVEPDDVEALTVELADKLAKGSRDALSEKTEWVLHSIACRAAIKAGDRTPPEQLIALAEEILSGKVPPFCPHGRPCVLMLTRKELEKQFGRIV